MNIKELQNRLGKIGVGVSAKTLREWGRKGLIENHAPMFPETGRGHEEYWSEESYQEAAAYRRLLDSGIEKRKALSVEKVAEIKQIAERVLHSPKIFRAMPSGFAITTPPQFIFDLQHVELKAETKDSKINDLVVTWIAAKEKAKHEKPISDPVRVIIDWAYDPTYDRDIYSSVIPELYSASDHGNPMLKALANLKSTMDHPYEVVKAASMALDGRGPSESEKGFTHHTVYLEPSQSDSDELVVYLIAIDR